MRLHSLSLEVKMLVTLRVERNLIMDAEDKNPEGKTNKGFTDEERAAM